MRRLRARAVHHYRWEHPDWIADVRAGLGVLFPLAIGGTAGADAGKIELSYDAYGTAGATTDLLVDVVGYYAPAGPPVTGVLTVPWADFFPGGPGGYAYSMDGHVGRSLTGVGGNAGNRLHAAIDLPQGATVTGVTFGIRDNGAQTPNVALYRFPKTSSFGDEIAGVDVTGADPAVRAISPPVDATRAVVDNDQFMYVATVFLTNWTAASNVEITFVTITYTTT